MSIDASVGSGPLNEPRAFTPAEAGDLVESVKAPSGLSDASSLTHAMVFDDLYKICDGLDEVFRAFFISRDVAYVGCDSSLRTYGIMRLDEGFKVFSSTKDCIKLDGRDVSVDFNVLLNVMANYQTCGLEAAVAYLDEYFANEKEAQ